MIDSNLADSESAHALLRTQRVKEISDQCQAGDRVLFFVVYIGHGCWLNKSMNTFNQAQRSFLDIESALRTCAQMPAIDVVAFFDCCRQEAGCDNRQNSIRKEKDANYTAVYREEPNQTRPCSCERLSLAPNLVDYLLSVK